MKKLTPLLSLALAFVWTPNARADVLAVTHADFSTAAQGTNGFLYGYYDGPDSTTNAFLSSPGQMQAGMDDSRPVWYATGSGTNLPNMVSFMQHPGPSWEGSKPAVRRYVVGSSGEPSFTGSVRVVGRFYDLNGGSTNVFVAVDLDGDGGSAPRELKLASTPLNGPAPMSFDFDATVASGTTIDFGVLSNGDFNSDATGLVAWIVTEDSAVPTNVVANNYNSLQFSTGSGAQDSRGLAVALVTDGVVSGSDIGSFDTVPGTTYTHAGLLYSENSGSGKVTRFNSMRIDVTTGADFAELPQLFLLRHNSDPGSLSPAQDERYVQLPVTAVRVAANSAGQPYYTFDLTSLPESQRTGYGFAVFGRGSLSGGAIAVSEISADAVRVSDAGHAPAFPTFIENKGRRYALTFTRGTWEQCEAEAVSYGGHLVSLNSAAENDWVFDALGRGALTYIGLRQNPLQTNVEPNGGWTWMDGTVLSDINGSNLPGVYRNWNDGSVGGSEPNHSGGAGEDYAVFASDVFSGRSNWGDVKNAGYPETANFRGIIEVATAGNPSGERNHQLTVSGKANIFGAGQANSTPSTSGGAEGGVAAPWVNVYSGEKIRLTASSGSVYSGAESAGPDGARHPTRRCDITGVAGISGYVNRNNSAHLVGVFVSETALTSTPARLDFSSDATGEAFTTLSPGLGQVFFIGDGLTPGGKAQEFTAPAGANRLFIGFPDAWQGDYSYIYTGPPNGYGDNSGSWSIRLAVTPTLTPQATAFTFPGAGSALTAVGGTGPYTWSIASGSLPPHLALDSSGNVTLTSTPRVNGSTTFTVRVTDAGSIYTDRSFTVVVADPIASPAGLAAWWPGQSTVADIIGGDHLAVAPSSSFGYGPGKVGRAFYFDGTSQSLQTATTDVMKHLPLTIEAWIKPEARTTGTLVSYLPTNVIANDRRNFGGHGFGAHLYPDGSMLRVGIEGATEDFRTVPGVTFTDNTWVHVAVVYTEGNVKTYIDGVKVDDYSFTQGALNGGDIIRVGRHNDDTGFGSLRFFKGAIDEVSLYHAELGTSQVSALYRAGTGGKKRSDAGMEFFTGPTQQAGRLWTYGSFPGSIDPSAFALSETFGTASNGIAYWAPSGGGVAAVNPTGALIKELGGGGYWIHTLPQQIRQHPGSGRPNVVRWKAPAAGRYATCGSFTGLDEYGVNTSVYVYHKNLPMVQLNGQAASASLANEFAGNGHSFTGVIDAQEGDTVDFIVSGDASFDSTGTFASVVYLGPSLEAPSTLTIETQSPPKTERVWTFQTQRPNDFQGLALRIQYAEANAPNDWQDIDTGDGSNTMLEPEQGDDTWTLFVPFLELPAAGNYRFRVVASAAGYLDKEGPAFGVDAMGGTTNDPISIGEPGQPPPPPAAQSMPAVTKMTYSIGGKASVTTAAQGQVGRFMITQSHPPGTPKPTIKVQWSTTPANEQSWQNVESQVAIYSGAVKNVSTASISTPELPSGTGVYFRTLTSGTGRLATAGPVLSNVVKPIGPINITPGPIWEYVSVTASSTSDITGKTAKVGDVIRYEITFKNDGDAPATDVLVTLPVPTGTVLRGGESTHRSTVITDTTNMSSIKELKWFIPTVAIGDPIEKYMTVTVTDPTKLSAITMKGSSIGLKSDELGTALNSSGNPWVFQKDIVTTLFSGLRLTLEGNDAEDDGDPVGIAKMGQVIYYSLKAENRGGSQITNATASLSIPIGMTLEYLRLPGTSGDFTDSILDTPSPSSNPSLTPYVYKKQQLITWNLGTVPGNTTREMKFALRVMFDLESTRFVNGAYATNSVSIDDYKFTAKSGKTTLNAFAGKGPAVTSLLTDEWYATRAPNLVLTKTACADGAASGSLSPALERLPNGQLNPQLLTTNIPGIGVAAAPHRNTRMTYTLNWANKYYPPPRVGQNPPDNRLPATARNAVIREEIPSNTTFVGFLRLNDAPAPSSVPFTFLTRDLFAIPSGGESFIDKAPFNGKRDTNETYTDSNGNKRYDAFTDTRFIEYRIGSLAAGASGKLTYDVIATGLEGNSIVSRAEGAIIPAPSGGVLYKGYSIWCENRYQAGTSTPEKLVGVISRPVRIEPPVITAGNQRDLQPAQGENVRLEIGYKVSGLSNATLQDYQLTITVPKPLTVVANGRTGMVNSSLPISSTLRSLRGYHPDQSNPFRRGESAPTITNRTNDTLVVFKLGGLIGGQSGAVGLELQMPANLPKSLFDAQGYLLVKSYDIKAEMSHAAVGTTIVRPASGMIIVEPVLRAVSNSVSTFLAASGTPLIGDLLKPTTRMFLGRTYPLSVRADGSTFDMIIFFGNATDTYMQGGKITMNVPPGLTLKSQTPVVYYYTGATPAQDNLYERNNVAGPPVGGVFSIETLDMAPHTIAAVLLTFEVSKSIQGNTIEDGSLCVTTQNASTKIATRMSIGIQRDNWFGNLFNTILSSLFNGMSDAVANLLRPANERLITVNSRTISIVNADFVHLLNGSVIIPLKGGRTAAVGPPANVLAGIGCILQDDGGIRIAAAHQSVSGFKIAGISTAFGANQTWSPSAILEGLGSTGFANLVAAGGGNLVAAGGGNLIGLDGSTLLNNNTGLIAGTIAFRGPTLVAAGGGNMVAAGGGNMVAAGGGNLIGNDGSTLIGLDSSSLIGLDSSSFKLGTTNLVAAGGGNLVAAGGGNMVAAGGGNMVAAGGMNFSAAAASSSLQSAAAGIATSRLAGAGIIQDLSRVNMQGILSHNGGQILSHNGGVLISP
jgi:uncharacterized repeat protein (TIGR01451 family)